MPVRHASLGQTGISAAASAHPGQRRPDRPTRIHSRILRRRQENRRRASPPPRGTLRREAVRQRWPASGGDPWVRSPGERRRGVCRRRQAPSRRRARRPGYVARREPTRVVSASDALRSARWRSNSTGRSSGDADVADESLARTSASARARRTARPPQRNSIRTICFVRSTLRMQHGPISAVVRTWVPPQALRSRRSIVTMRIEPLPGRRLPQASRAGRLLECHRDRAILLYVLICPLLHLHHLSRRHRAGIEVERRGGLPEVDRYRRVSEELGDDGGEHVLARVLLHVIEASAQSMWPVTRSSASGVSRRWAMRSPRPRHPRHSSRPAGPGRTVARPRSGRRRSDRGRSGGLPRSGRRRCPRTRRR